MPKSGNCHGKDSEAIRFYLRSRSTNQSTMNFVSGLKRKFQSAQRRVEGQDFISRPWAIALLVIMAVVSILILAPTIVQQLPESWSEVARNQEALKNQLVAVVDRLSPTLRYDFEKLLQKVKTNPIFKPIQSLSLATILCVAVGLAVVYNLWPEYFQQIVDTIQ